MNITDKDAFAEHLSNADINMAQLGRKAGGVSRQFIWALVKGHKTRCTPEVASGIERALGLTPGTLFSPDKSEPARKRAA